MRLSFLTVDPENQFAMVVENEYVPTQYSGFIGRVQLD